MTVPVETAEKAVPEAGRLLAAWAARTGAAGRGRAAELGWDFVVARAEGAYVLDTAGTRYLDCHTGAGIANLGHRPPELVAAVKRAVHETDQGNFPLISAEKAALAADLAAFAGGRLPGVTFGVVRGEIFDFACKLARGATGRKVLLAAEGCWFGQTGFALSLSTRPEKALFGPLIPETRILAVEGDALLGAVGSDTAAVMVEPLQAENHCREISAETLRVLRARCSATGTLLVADETQTGFGRTGRKFALEESGVEPDVLVVGEALGAALFPIVAALATEAVQGFMHAHPLLHLSTFGGSDLACVAARAALASYAAVRPWENAAREGKRLRAGLEEIARRAPAIESIAGRGLLVSLGLGTPERARAFCRALARARVLAVPGEVARHTVVLRPSLTLGEDDVALLLDAVAQAAAAADAAP